MDGTEVALEPDAVNAWARRLRVCATAGPAGGEAAASEVDPAALVDLLAALEVLKSAASAVQARAAVQLDHARRAQEARAGVPLRARGRSVGHEVALARRESPHRGGTLLGAACAWVREMPHAFAALAAGALSEYRAMLLVQQTAFLTVEARAEVDELVCADRARLSGLGTRRLVALARGHAVRLDPAGAARRASRAAADRTVTLRPAPDTMTYLTALLPAAQGVAALAALRSAAATARAEGDPRGASQVMADALVARVTGQASADAVPVAVDLVISDETLLGAGHPAAGLDGFGPVPAQVARNLVAQGLDADAVWLRRVYAGPGGELVAATSSARFHPDGLATMLRVRDQGICRTPYCDAPISQRDHVVPSADGGPTDLGNGQGLCEACNHAKQQPGWRQAVDPPDQRPADPGDPAAPSGRHRVVTTTPTGHRHVSEAPALPVPCRAPRVPGPAAGSRVDLAFEELLRGLVVELAAVAP